MKKTRTSGKRNVYTYSDILHHRSARGWVLKFMCGPTLRRQSRAEIGYPVPIPILVGVDLRCMVLVSAS